MAVLTRPLFHAQERIDLEDFNQILSGLRTDSRLWVRQVYADKNFILKGFEATGINTNQLSVNIFDATMLFAGRRDLTAQAVITINSSTLVSTPTVITIFNSDGNQLTFTSSDTVNTGTNWVESNAPETSALSLARAISTVEGLGATASAGVITITTTNVGFTNITATPQSMGFVTVTGDIISSFNYATNIVESPGDLSYFIVQSSVTGNDAILTSEITAGQRADSTQASKSLAVYISLGTTSGTPITKAFWDPSANGGSGGEFNQRVNTATDLNVTLEVRDGVIDPSTEAFFERVPICEIDVDSSGTIIAIRDVRPLLFEADDRFVLNQTTPFVTIGLKNSVTNFTPADIVAISSGLIVNERVFVDGEDVEIVRTDSNETNGIVTATAELTAVVGAPPNDNLTLEKFDLSQAPARQRVARGVTSGAIRIIDSVSSNFFRDDKSLGNFRDTISTIATEIRKIKGTQRWYEDPKAALEDVLRFINSSLVGKNDKARFVWTGTNLDLKISPTFAGNVTFVNFANIASGDKIVVAGQTFTVSTTLNTVNNFQKEVDTDRVAENFRSAINRNTGTGFGEAGIRAAIDPAERSRVLLTTDATSISSQTIAVTVTTAGSITKNDFEDFTSSDPLAAVRIYGHAGSFDMDAFSIPIKDDEVLFITLPDLEENPTASSTVKFSSTGTDAPFIFADSGPVSGTNAVANTRNTAWNATEKTRFETTTTIYKTAPLQDFERNSRNYWIAFRETGTNIIQIRGVGEVGQDEIVSVGEGVSSQTLTYIGAPNETTANPTYSSVATIDTFRTSTVTEGAYTSGTGADYNFNEIGSTDSLTLGISNLNDHLTTLRDTQYQNHGIRLVDGGFFTWDINDSDSTIGTLNWSANAFLSVPGLVDITNTISAPTTAFSIPAGSVLYVDINRVQSSTPAAQTLAPKVVTMDAFIPHRDRFILARRIGQFVYIGVGSSMRIGDSESAPIDGELAFFGLKGNQLPRQLRSVPNGTMAVDVGGADINFPIGGLNTASTFDDFVTLTVPLNSGIAFWEGATFDFSGTAGGTFSTGQGKILTQGTTTFQPFRSRTISGGLLRTFELAALGSTNNAEAWYTVGLSGDTAIVAADPEITILENIATNVTPNITPVIGRNKGEPVVTTGTIGSTLGTTGNARALIPEFAGEIPVVAFRVSNNASGVRNDLAAGDVIVLASAGGGGGGSGDASSNLDLLLDRFNLAPFQYVSPLVASIDALDVLDNDNGNDVGVSSSSYAFTSGDDFVTIDLLDNDFLNGSSVLSKIDIMGLWGRDNTDLPSIDPNARYFVTQDPTNLTVAEANATTYPVTPALTLSIAAISTTNSTISIIDHTFETGQRVTSSPTGFTIGASTNDIVRRIDNSTISLHGSIADAEADTNRLALVITSGTIGGTISRVSGIISRVDQTTTVRSSFVFPDVLQSASVTITSVNTNTIILDEGGSLAASFTLAGASTAAIATALATSINSNVNYSAVVDSSNTNRVRIYREGALSNLVIAGTAVGAGASKTDFIITPSQYGLRLRIEANNTGTFTGVKLLAAVGVYYAFEEGFEGVLQGTQDFKDLIRDNHLVGTTDSSASFGSPGRGVVLLNGGGSPTEIALDNNNDITIGGTAPIVTNGATNNQILRSNSSGQFSPSGGLSPIGSIIDSILTPTQLNAQSSAEWVLCDGRSISGSSLATLTSMTSAPNFIGRAAMMTGSARPQLTIADFNVFVDSDTITVNGVVLNSSASVNTGLNFQATSNNNTTAENLIAAINRNKIFGQTDIPVNANIVGWQEGADVVVSVAGSGALSIDGPENKVLGTSYAGQNLSHNHTYRTTRTNGNSGSNTYSLFGYNNSTPIDTPPTSFEGGNEARPYIIAVNKFIRIN